MPSSRASEWYTHPVQGNIGKRISLCTLCRNARQNICVYMLLMLKPAVERGPLK